MEPKLFKPWIEEKEPKHYEIEALPKQIEYVQHHASSEYEPLFDRTLKSIRFKNILDITQELAEYKEELIECRAELADYKEELWEYEAELIDCKKKIRELELQYQKLFVQDILAQNDKGIKNLLRLSQSDEGSEYDPKDLEGILAPYSDTESSVEWIRAVRDSS